MFIGDIPLDLMRVSRVTHADWQPFYSGATGPIPAIENAYRVGGHIVNFECWLPL